MPYYNKQRGSWTAQVVWNQQKHRSQHSSRESAALWEDAKRQELSEGVNHEPLMCMESLYEWAVAYLDWSKDKHSDKTYMEKQHAFRQFFKSFNPDMEPSDLQRFYVLRHFQRQSQLRSGNAANKDRKNLMAAWGWAARYFPSWPQDNPFCVHKLPEQRTPRQVPSEEDFWAVYGAAESEQDKVMLLCYLHLAARRNEIFQLRLEDVDLDRRRIRLSTRKRKDGSQHFDWLAMTDRLHRELTRHLAATSGPWVFPDPATGQPYVVRSKWLARLCRLSGVRSFGLHGIRHLSASILADQEVPLTDVQAVLRHTSLITTQRYVHRLKTGRCLVSVFEG